MLKMFFFKMVVNQIKDYHTKVVYQQHQKTYENLWKKNQYISKIQNIELTIRNNINSSIYHLDMFKGFLTTVECK